jgi:hypothetical protein
VKAAKSNTMRYYLLFVAPCILLHLFAIDCKAQSIKVDTSFHPHWEIGVDLLPLIDKENAPKNSLFARRNYFQKNGLGRAWRMRAGVEVEVRDFTGVARWTPDIFRTYAPYLSIGHEWQRVSKGFRWFVGVEGSGSYVKKDFFYLASLADSLRQKVVVNEKKVGVKGILGFQVRLSSNIWLSSEAALSANFWHYHKKVDDYYRGILATGIKSEDFDDVFSINFHPLYVINLIYSLKSIHHESKKT